MAAENRRASKEARTLIGQRKANTCLIHTASVHITLYRLHVMDCMMDMLFGSLHPAALLGSVCGRRIHRPVRDIPVFALRRIVPVMALSSQNVFSLYLPAVVCFCYSFFDSFHDCIEKPAYCCCSMMMSMISLLDGQRIDSLFDFSLCFCMF